MLQACFCMCMWVCLNALAEIAGPSFIHEQEPASAFKASRGAPFLNSSHSRVRAVDALRSRLIWQHRARSNPSLNCNLFTLHSKRIFTKIYTRSDAENGQKINKDAFLLPFFVVVLLVLKREKSLYILWAVNPLRERDELKELHCWLILMLLLCKHPNVIFPLWWYSQTAQAAPDKWHLSLP